MKIFITGGDGFLGSNLVRELLSRGHELTLLIQENRQVKTLEGLNIKRVYGDVLNYESLVNGAKGAEVVIHAAASTSNWPSRSEIVNKINIEGTSNIIKMVKELGIKKLVYVGTANSFGFGDKENPGNETKPYGSLKYKMDYMDSKYKAQLLVLDAVKEGLLATIVNPTFMIGPYDSNPNTGEMILAIHAKEIPICSPGGRCFIHVRDAAVGISNAIEKGRIGECYILGNENLNYKEIFAKMAKVVGVKPPTVVMPCFLVLIYGRLIQFFADLFHKKPKVTYSQAKISCDEHFFSAKKAIEELDLPQTPIEIAIEESFNWLNENGYVK